MWITPEWSPSSDEKQRPSIGWLNLCINFTSGGFTFRMTVALGIKHFYYEEKSYHEEYVVPPWAAEVRVCIFFQLMSA